MTSPACWDEAVPDAATGAVAGGRALRLLLLAVVVVVAALVRLPLIELEFGRNGDGTGTLYSIAARNYLLRDNTPTLWMPVISVGDAQTPPTVYAHHPPAVPLLMAASIAVFGDRTVSHRLPAAVSTVLACGMVYLLLTRRTASAPRPDLTTCAAAAAAALLLAVSPLALRFGQMPDVVNAQLVFLMLLGLHVHLRVLDRPSAGRQLLAVAVLGAAALTDWPAFFLFLVLFAHAVVRRCWSWATVLAAVAIVLFSVLVAWTSLAAGDWGLLLRQFANRSIKAQTDAAQPFTWWDWVSYAVVVSVRQLGPVLAVVGAVAVGVAAVRGRLASRTPVLLLAVTAALHALVGRQAAYNHDWWWWPVGTALVLAAGAATLWLHRPGRTAAAAAALALATLPWSWSEYRLLHSREYLTGAETNYTLVELGEAVRRHTPLNRTALLFQDDPQPYVFYHVQRPVIQRVWDVAAFESALAARHAELFYSFQQTLTEAQRPATLVVPAVYAAQAKHLLAYVRGRYREVTDGPFLVFLLDNP